MYRNSEMVYRVSKRALIFFALLFVAQTLTAQNRVIKEKSFQVKSGEKLYVEAEGTDITVRSWNKGEVEIKVFGDRDAEDKMDFDFERTSDAVKVYAEKRGGFFGGWFSSIRCKIEIKVPEKFNAFVKTSGGDIALDELEGKIDLKTSGGDIDVSGTKGEMYLHTSGGDVKVSGHTGESSLTTSGGDIKGSDLNGDVDASTSGGDIVMEIKSGKVDASTSGGDIDVVFAGVNKGIDCRTSGGDITLRVPTEIKGDFELRASGGRVYCDLNSTKVYEDSKRHFEGEINGGGEKVFCKTSGGDVEVK